MLLLPVVAFSQFKIGSVSLKDSSGVLVFSSPLKTNTTDQWISRTWLPSLVVSTNSGLKWDATTGLTLKLGSGLILQNDTLKYNGSSIVAVDDSTIQYVGQKLKVKYSEGLTSDIYGVKLNLSTNSGLTYDGLGKLIINSDSGVSITGNKLKVKLDATNLEFDGIGNLKIKANSITETQISKDINLDSLKIGNMVLKVEGEGKLAFSDSLGVVSLFAKSIYLSGLNQIIKGDFNEIEYNKLTPYPMRFYNNNIKTMQLDAQDGIVFYNTVRMDTARFQGWKGADVASDNPLVLGAGNYFEVTGTNAINNIDGLGWQSGSIITLKFSGAVNLGHMAGTSGTNYEMFLFNSENFTTSVGDILTFILDVDIWREISRTDN